MIWASCRKASGDMVPGFRVFIATLVVPFQVPRKKRMKMRVQKKEIKTTLHK